MELLKKGDKIFVKIKGGAVPEDFIESLESGKIDTGDAAKLIRVEHPHCAFFKSGHSAGDTEYQRTTLYTPEGRLHIDREKGKEELPQTERFVTKNEHLDILLFYLRDLEVKPEAGAKMENAQLIEMPNSPMAEFFYFTESGFFSEILSEYEMMAKHIFSQLRRIYNEKIDILAADMAGKAEYAVFNDIPDAGINHDLLERWHYYYIRKARLLK